MSVKLTKYTREQMARALVKHKLADRAAALCERSAALFNEVLDERYDAQTRKLMAQIAKRVKNAFSDTDSLYICANGMRVTIGASSIGYYSLAYWVPEVASRPTLNAHDDSEPSPDLASKIASFAMDTQAFTADLRASYGRALTTLGQFTTGKRLSEEWPEAIPVIGHLLNVEDRALPVVQLTAINDEFDLPPSDLEVAA